MAARFILTNLTGTTLGELVNASDRQVALPHMRTPTAACKIPLWDPMATNVMDTDTLLKVYMDGTLVFHGPVFSAEETATDTEQSIQINAVGPFWRLTKRFFESSLFPAGAAYGTSGSPLDFGVIVQTMINELNSVDHTGITVTSITASRSGYVGPYWLKNAAEAITEMTVGTNSFEFVVNPVEAGSPGVHGHPTIANMVIAPTIGAAKPNAVFEYGTSKGNVSSYGRLVTRDGLMTRGHISVEGWPSAPMDPSGLISGGSGIQNTRGYFEDQVPDAGIIDGALRLQLLNFHLLLRKFPRQTLTFTPITNCPLRPTFDYGPGDTVRARVVIKGTQRYDASLRVWGVTMNWDNEGNRTDELELVLP